jgi:hypothetical protein
MSEFRRGVPKLRLPMPPEPFPYCQCARPDNEAWSDLCKTCKCLVAPLGFEDDTSGVGWPE